MKNSLPNPRRPNLRGQALAEAYAATFSRYGGTISASYDEGGWITVHGTGLKPHPDLAAQYPNGWEMLHRVRSSRARAELVTLCS